MNSLLTSVTQIAVLIVGLAVVAVIVSRNANTANVITSAGNAFTAAIGAAVKPVE